MSGQIVTHVQFKPVWYRRRIGSGYKLRYNGSDKPYQSSLAGANLNDTLAVRQTTAPSRRLLMSGACRRWRYSNSSQPQPTRPCSLAVVRTAVASLPAFLSGSFLATSCRPPATPFALSEPGTTGSTWLPAGACIQPPALPSGRPGESGRAPARDRLRRSVFQSSTLAGASMRRYVKKKIKNSFLLVSLRCPGLRVISRNNGILLPYAL